MAVSLYCSFLLVLSARTLHKLQGISALPRSTFLLLWLWSSICCFSLFLFHSPHSIWHLMPFLTCIFMEVLSAWLMCLAVSCGGSNGTSWTWLYLAWGRPWPPTEATPATHLATTLPFAPKIHMGKCYEKALKVRAGKVCKILVVWKIQFLSNFFCFFLVYMLLCIHCESRNWCQENRAGRRCTSV